MKEILFASTNKGKVVEVLETAKSHKEIQIILPSELPSKLGAAPDVEESGDTYKENALLKSYAYFAWANIPALADDTGLEVEVLNGIPGVKSARYAGEPSDPKKNIAKLLNALTGVTNRKARFICVLSLVGMGPKEIIVEAFLPGSIIEVPRGTGGFGYDSIFLPEGHKETLSELKASGKEIKTHRILALEKLFPMIESL